MLLYVKWQKDIDVSEEHDFSIFIICQSKKGDGTARPWRQRGYVPRKLQRLLVAEARYSWRSPHKIRYTPFDPKSLLRWLYYPNNVLTYMNYRIVKTH